MHPDNTPIHSFLLRIRPKVNQKQVNPVANPEQSREASSKT